MKLFDELKWRGLIDNVTNPELEAELNDGELTFYIGTDPTGDSLHIGHYSSLLTAKRLKEAGHHPIMLWAALPVLSVILKPAVSAIC